MMVNLYLMTQKGYLVLKALAEQRLLKCVSQVVVGTDSHVVEDFSEKIIDVCKTYQIPFSMRGQGICEADFSIAVSWRWMIRDLNTRLIVLHDSLLPKYRGFAPLVNMLIHKEPTIGVTALYASEEYDRGNIIEQASMPIQYPIRISEAIELVSGLYVKLVVSIVEMLASEIVPPSTEQDELLATYSLWRDDEDYRIDWNCSAGEIVRFIDAVSFPYRGALTVLNGMHQVRVMKAEEIDDVHIMNRDVGKVIFVRGGFPSIVCKSGLLIITDAVDAITGQSVLPLKIFRSRFS